MTPLLRRAAYVLCLGLGLGLGGPRAAAQADAAATDAPPELPSVQGSIAAGAGAGDREISLPSSEGTRRLSTGIFPALDVTLHGEAALGEHAILGLHLRYQTSLGMSAQETPAAGTTHATPARVHHLDAGLMPAVRFQRSQRSVVLGAFVGWGLRSFASETALTLAPYTLHGPLVRLELRVPLGGSGVVLRLAPELFAWLFATQSLRDAGDLGRMGIAFGGEAALAIALAERVRLDLCYRQSQGTIKGLLDSFEDTERFGSLQLELVY